VEMSTAPKIIAYYGSWSAYREGAGKFEVENIDPSLCTHVIYAFAGLDGEASKIKVLDPWNDLPDDGGKNGYGRFTGLKKLNPSLCTMLAIGGWNEGSTTYSKMAADPSRRKIFIESVIQLLRQYNFDGLDLDWEYPANRGGIPADKGNFILLVKELKQAFKQHNFILSAAVGMGPSTVKSAYDVPALGEYLDFINLMTYDFHGPWENHTAHHTPLHCQPQETGDEALLNLESSVATWLDQGVPAHKLILGHASYGKTYTIDRLGGKGLCVPAKGPGSPGIYTKEPGILAYYEILSQTKNWDKHTDDCSGAPWTSKEDQWICYDNEESLKKK
ncbi:unnamed protein product, partial [Meganyctiphanes norvegica]